MLPVTRRAWLQLAGLGSAATATLFGARRLAGQQPLDKAQGAPVPSNPASHAAMDHGAHIMGPVGRVSTEAFNPTTFTRSWNFSDLPPEKRERFYTETSRPDGSLLREYQIVAVDREIEIAPGVYFPAWTYNGQVPGPTLRATEGDRMRITFVNQGSHPHTMHFHGWHHPDMDGSMPQHQVLPGGKFVYEFDAEPFGLHLYHCHAVPLKRHLHKGLYGAFIIDPKQPRPPADELVMVMNGFDTNFDADNEVYAVNTVANHFVNDPIRVEVGKLVRIYLINVTEFDLINSLHLHGMFFDVFRTGTSLTRTEVTDLVMLCQGERGIIELEFHNAGTFMFHAHQSEFAELGWMGYFDVSD